MKTRSKHKNKRHMENIGGFPRVRLRRNRTDEWLRRLIRENNVVPGDLVFPVFIQEGKQKSTPITSMPDVFRLSADIAVKKIKEAKSLGIAAVAIFPCIDKKLRSDNGNEAINPRNLVCRTIDMIKQSVPEIGIISDIALDPYTTHGHDGLFINGKIENDRTIEVLCKQAIAEAKAGCDIVAPSDMMDGRIGAIRDALDDEGFQDVKIMSYAVKYASNFYGPFREAVGSSASLRGDKKTYQMDFSNSYEAVREVELDIKEGADMVLIKPGMPYLDIIRRIKEEFNIPIFSYQVSGEYSMIKAASERGWLDEDKAMYESLIAFKRAGATGVFTYAALKMAKLLNENVF